MRVYYNPAPVIRTDRDDLLEGVKMISLHLTVSNNGRPVSACSGFKDAGQEEEVLVAAETWTPAFLYLHAFNLIHKCKP